MKTVVKISVEVDAEKWADAAGLNPGWRAKDVVEDIRTYLLNAAQQLSLIDESDAEVELAR
jgi:hypothetical protein